LKKNEIRKAKLFLKKIRIETIFDILTKNCWKYDIQYELLIKKEDMLIIKLRGNKEYILLIFHKTDLVTIDEYTKFNILANCHRVTKAIYITTGCFHEAIQNEYKDVLSFFCNVKLENGFRFIKGQLGLYGKAVKVFKYKKLDFFCYMPD
jgi:hypothetical protein